MQKTKSFFNLRRWAYELRKPALTVMKPLFNKFDCYAFNENKQLFIFGFDTGEVTINLQLFYKLSIRFFLNP